MNKNRGMFLETLINKTIVLYEKNDIGIFHKKPIPINFRKLTKQNGKLLVENGVVASKSTTDYYGVYKGLYIAFEAKSSQTDRIPISNLKEHQRSYIRKINNHGGLAFYIVGFTSYNEYYIITEEMVDGSNLKSLTLSYIQSVGYPLEVQYPGMIDFASVIDKMM